MSKERILELFGQLDSDDLTSLFCGYKKIEGFESLPNTYNVQSNEAWFVVKHIESGEHYGMIEYNMDSWSEGSSTAWEQGYSIYALEPYQLTVTQYKKLSYPTELTPKNRW